MNRVLHIVTKMGYGGIETLLMNIYRNIDRQKVQFDFAVTSKEKGEYDDEIKQLGGKIFYLPKRNKKLWKYKKEWEAFFEENATNYTTVHMHVSSLSNILPIKMAKKYNIPNRFMHSHNTHQKGYIHNVLNRTHRLVIKKYANKLFACSSEAGKYCFGNHKFEILKNGIDTKQYIYCDKEREQNRETLGIMSNQIALIHVGRFMEQKNHMFLIDIFYELLKKESNSVLFMVGTGELKKEIEGKVRKLEIAEKVHFLGSRNDVNKILQAMDMFLLPSLHEGLPLVGIEAQASGLQCIMSDTISKEVKITDLVTFIPIENAEQWVDTILKQREYRREDTHMLIKQAGYDIIDTTKRLEKYYQS